MTALSTMVVGSAREDIFSFVRSRARGRIAPVLGLCEYLGFGRGRRDTKVAKRR